jgi:hypothetical protein
MSGLSFPAVDKAIWLLSGIGEFKNMPEKSSRLLRVDPTMIIDSKKGVMTPD